MMNRISAVFAVFAFGASTAAFAAKPACDAQAAEKKLSGSAKTSFVKKCEKDATEAATKTCEGQAADKKLAGAAKNSFVKKCVTDATAAASREPARLHRDLASASDCSQNRATVTISARRGVRFWLVSDRRVRRPRPGLFDYTSVCSASSRASSTSIPRYLTVLSSFVWPSNNLTNRRFLVRL